jgi:hypothetical protein
MSYEWRFDLYEGYSFRPWRLLIILYTIPGIISGLWLMKFPESPRFLLSVQREDEALAIVKWIYRTNKGKSNDDDFNIEKLQSEMSEVIKRNYKGM